MRTLIIASCLLATPVNAQIVSEYGPNISLKDAQAAATAALDHARGRNWKMAVAVTDTAGNLVYFARVDNTHVGSMKVAVAKARSAALFKRPTKAFQDALAQGGEGLRVLKLEEAIPIEGGLPIMRDSRVVGAIGLSGGTSAEDGDAARAGVAAVK